MSLHVHNVLTVTKREFLARIKTKGFWIGTVLLPVLMGAWIVVPGLLMDTTQAEQRLALVDRTGEVTEPLGEELARREEEGIGQARFDLEVLDASDDREALRAELDRQVLSEEIDAWLWIGEGALESGEGAEGDETGDIEYHAENVSNWVTQRDLERALSKVIRELRLSRAGYDTEQIAELSRSVGLSTVRVSEEGSRAEGGVGGFALAIGLFMILYMVILIYGQQVLQGVLEEKSSRIVEVMLSSVRPVDMMAGKLLGVCCVGLVQLAVWVGTALVLTAPGLLTAVAFMPEESNLPQIPLMVVVHFFGHFLMGYFLFASFYAMIGAAFNDLQEAQQLASVAVVIFIILPFMFLMPVVNDPDSTLAVVTSLIPPLTPLMMMLRVAIKTPPWWQLALGYVLGFGFTAFMVWVSARVYRVGVLMYGKKPTVQEIWRWARYQGAR